MKRSLKKNYKLILGMIIGVIISGVGAYAATTISSSNISYDNSKSGLTSTNMKGAIDELYEKSDIRKQGNFISAYTYSTTTSTKCITGEESTCKKSSCYKSKTSGSCKAGDIIKYKVNDTDIITFHVMFDNGTTLTMQSQKNIVKSTAWNAIEDIKGVESTQTKCSGDVYCYLDGPYTILRAIANATSSWSNVNKQTFSIGTTSFSGKGNYTNCFVQNCSENTYTWSEKTTSARIISVQEASYLGCDMGEKSCPKWMYNYLSNSISYGGTVNDTAVGENSKTSSKTNNSDYYTLNTRKGDSSTGGYPKVWMINTKGQFDNNYVYDLGGARAVVIVNK